MITGPYSPPMVTVFVAEHTLVALLVFKSGVRSLLAFMSFDVASMWAGVVPQHPPKMAAPDCQFFNCAFAKSSGLTLKTVFPFSKTGKPAFG